MFKVNNKITRTTPLTSFWSFIVSFEHISHLFRVTIVDFEPLNVSWVHQIFSLLSVLKKDVLRKKLYKKHKLKSKKR